MSPSDLMLRLTPRDLLLLSAAGLLLVAAAAWQLLLREQVQGYRVLVAERGASAQEVARERAGLDREALEAAAVRIARLEERLYGAGPPVPVSEMASHVIGRLDGLAGDFQVRLAGVKPGPQTEVLDFTEIPFDVQVEGDYPRLVDWLLAVERGLRPMVVKRFRFEPIDGAGILRMDLRVVSYRAPRLP